MANKSKEPESTPIVAGQPEGAATASELHDVEMFRSKHNISWAVFAGVCAAQGWRPGKMVSEKAFLRAVEQFNGEPMRASGGEVRK